MKRKYFVTDYLSTYDVIVLTHQSDQKCIWPLLLSNCILLHETFHDYSFWEALCKIQNGAFFDDVVGVVGRVGIFETGYFTR